MKKWSGSKTPTGNIYSLGIYSVHGIDESWSFFNNYNSHDDYLKQLDGFTAKNYDPAYWAELISYIGAKYAVITTKHHDGFALWDTKCGNMNAVKQASAGRDLLTPLVDGIRDRGLGTQWGRVAG